MGFEQRDELALIHDYYRTLFENSLDLIILLDGDAVIKFISSSVEKVLGYAPEEVMGTCIFEYIQFDEVKQAKITFDRLIMNPCAKEYFECHAECKDGHWLAMEAVGESFMDHPCISGIVVNARDITRRKMAEKELKKNEERFKAVIDSIAEIILVANGEGDVKLIGEPIFQVLGYTPDEVGSINLFDLLHPDDLETIIPIILGISAEPGAKANFSFKLKHKNGEWRHLEATATNHADNPSIAGNLYVVRDVTGKTAEAERLEVALKAFIDYATHEFRQEITLLKRYSSLLRNHRDRIGETEIENIYVAMEASSDRLNSLVTGISYAEDI